MAIPPKKETPGVDDFIQGAAATKADTAKAKAKKPVGPEPKFTLLFDDKEMREEIRIEAIQGGYRNMSEYVCHILRRRKELKG